MSGKSGSREPRLSLATNPRPSSKKKEVTKDKNGIGDANSNVVVGKVEQNVKAFFAAVADQVSSSITSVFKYTHQLEVLMGLRLVPQLHST